MANQDPHLYRPKALERFASPDNLERLIPAVRRKDWLSLTVTGVLIALGSAWCVAGTVPTVVSGRGVLLRPRRIVQAQTAVSGRLSELIVQQGDDVHAGDLIARLDFSELQKQIEEDSRSLARLEMQDGARTEAEGRQLALQGQQDILERKSLEFQRTTMTRSLSDAESMAPIARQRLDSVHRLVNEKLMGWAVRDVADAEQGYRDIGSKIGDLQARLEQTAGQLKQIDTRAASLERDLAQQALVRRNEIDDVRKTISIREFQFREDGDIHARDSGKVLELLAHVGQVLAGGTGVLSLEIANEDPTLTSISYFPVRDGKKIQPGMRIQITPDTVERERFGGIVGVVTSVSPQPVTREGALSVVGNPEIVQTLLAQGPAVEVRAKLETDPATPSGFKWSSSRGPALRMSAGLTHMSRVTLEGRAPVTYLLPILRDATGVY
jgi:HlyD family secretion protein